MKTQVLCILLAIATVSHIATYRAARHEGFTAGLKVCTKAVRIVNGTDWFTACYEEESKIYVVTPKKGGNGTITQSTNNSTVNMEISIPLTKVEIK